jgi:DNA-directed RNA polymerase specialized sigma24 family protein
MANPPSLTEPHAHARPTAFAGEVDTRSPGARLADPALRRALLAYAKSRGVPEREREDVVQSTLAKAWRGRASWPATRAGFHHWVFAIAFCTAIDEFRGRVRAALLKGKAPQDAAQEDDGDDDPVEALPAPPGATPEHRDGLRFVDEHAKKHPSWQRAFGWVLRACSGESYADIAASEGVTEEAVRSAIKKFRASVRDALGGDTAKLFLVLLVAVFLYGVFGPPKRDRETATPAPEPAPTMQAPADGADALRRRAFDECDAHRWTPCLEDLDRARDLDPAGESLETVRAARRAAQEATGGP